MVHIAAINAGYKYIKVVYILYIHFKYKGKTKMTRVVIIYNHEI